MTMEDRSTRRVNDVEDEDESERTPRNDNRQRIITIATSVVIAVLAMIIYTGQFVTPKMVSRTDFDANLGNVAADINANKAGVASNKESVTSLLGLTDTTNSLSTQISQLNDKINALTQTVSNVQNGLSNYALSSDVSSISDRLSTAQSQLNNMQGTISGLQGTVNNVNVKKSDIDALNDMVDDLDDLISDLETRMSDAESTITEMQTATTTSDGPTSSSEGINVSIKTINNALFVTGSNNETLSGTFKVVLANTQDIAKEDIILDILIQVSSLPSDMNGVPSLVGGTTTWLYRWQGVGAMEFYNSTWGLKLDASETKTLYLTVNIPIESVAEPQTVYSYFDVTVDVY